MLFCRACEIHSSSVQAFCWAVTVTDPSSKIKPRKRDFLFIFSLMMALNEATKI
jgi:hypothetical protein